MGHGKTAAKNKTEGEEQSLMTDLGVQLLDARLRLRCVACSVKMIKSKVA